MDRTLGVREAAKRMDAALAGNPYAKAAIEMALWDLLGKAAGLPLHRLLGGGTARPVPIKYVIGMMEPNRAREEATFAKELGFSYIKVKVGGELSEDLERLQAVASVLASGDRLGVDANGGWLLPTALAALAPLEELGIAFLEQPVAAEFPDAMAAVTAR